MELESDQTIGPFLWRLLSRVRRLHIVNESAGVMQRRFGGKKAVTVVVLVQDLGKMSYWRNKFSKGRQAHTKWLNYGAFSHDVKRPYRCSQTMTFLLFRKWVLFFCKHFLFGNTNMVAMHGNALSSNNSTSSVVLHTKSKRKFSLQSFLRQSQSYSGL